MNTYDTQQACSRTYMHRSESAEAPDPLVSVRPNPLLLQLLDS